MMYVNESPMYPMFMEPVMTAFGTPMGFCTRSIKRCVESEWGIVGQEIAPRLIDIVGIAFTAVALVISVVCLIFEALAKLVTKGIGLCNERVKEWHDENINLTRAAKFFVGIFALQLSTCTVGWIMPSSHVDASEAIGKWVTYEDDGLGD